MHYILAVTMLLLNFSMVAQTYTYQSILSDTGYTQINSSIEQNSVYYHVGEAGNAIGPSDLLFVSTDSTGNILAHWSMGLLPYGEAGNCIYPTLDNGFILSGFVTDSVTMQTDFLLVKTDSTGIIEWTRVYGGVDDEVCLHAEQTSNNGYLMAGYTFSFSTLPMAFIVQTDVNGAVVWTKAFSGDLAFEHFAKTPSGGYLFCGEANDPVTLGGVLAIKTDANGDTVWTRKYDGSPSEYCRHVLTASAGGYLLTGGSGNNGLLIRINENGDTLWTNAFARVGSPNVRFESAVENSSGNFVVTGSIVTSGSSWNVILLEVDPMGVIVRTKEFGGAGMERAMSVITTSDGGYLMGGITYSFGNSAYIIKTDAAWSSGCNEFTSTLTGTGTGVNVLSLSPSVITGGTDSTVNYPIASFGVPSVLCTVGIETWNDPTGAVNLFPNPVSVGMNPQLDATEPMCISVYSANGSLISTATVRPTERIVIPPTPGIYLVRIYKDDTLYSTQRIIRTE